MPKVAILGTEGTGKTVLMAVMASAFQRPRKGIQLIPMTGLTARHVGAILAYLREGEWPPSSPAGEFRDLAWKLHLGGMPQCDLQFQEIAGEDFRELFRHDEVTAAEGASAAQRNLLQYLERADIIVFLVNLGDFIGESDPVRREESQWALKHALDWVQEHAKSKRSAIVLTQIDQYEAIKQKHGNWGEVMMRYLPYVAGAHLQHGRVPLCAVSAIGDTRVAIDSNGIPRRVPQRKWRAYGVVALLQWIGRAAKEVEPKAQLKLRDDVQNGIDIVDADRAPIRNGNHGRRAANPKSSPEGAGDGVAAAGSDVKAVAWAFGNVAIFCFAGIGFLAVIIFIGMILSR